MSEMAQARERMVERQLARRRLIELKLERFIGVIYRPERWSHYSGCSLAQ